MQPRVLFTFLMALACARLAAQAPELINYQAVVRDAQGKLLPSEELEMKFEFVSGTNDSLLYCEQHSVQSNSRALISLKLGDGLPCYGRFQHIGWERGDISMKVNLDRGEGFVSLGSERLVAVPFSLFANEAAHVREVYLAEMRDVEVGEPEDGDMLQWNAASGRWESVSALSGGESTQRDIVDDDDDTRVTTQKNFDDDIIRFELDGTQQWFMYRAGLAPSNSGGSVFIGETAGIVDDLNNRRNVAVGYAALSTNVEGARNVALGSATLNRNETQNGIVAIGSSALQRNRTAGFVVAVGDSALFWNGDEEGGAHNVAVGAKALMHNRMGSGNTAIGSRALAEMQGDRNTALGSFAMHLATEGSGNTAIGHSSLFHSTGQNNTALGDSALGTATAAEANTALGFHSLRSTTEGHWNTAVGMYAGAKNIVGHSNTLLGYDAHYFNETGSHNTALGTRALFNSQEADSNVAIGTAAMHEHVSGSRNVTIGPEARYHYTAGDENISIGYRVGYGLSQTSHHQGDNNIAIGSYALDSIVASSDNIAIGTRGLSAAGSGSDMIAIGREAMPVGHIGTIAIGAESMPQGAGPFDIGIGYQAMSNGGGSGAYNTAVGGFAGPKAYGRSRTSAFGYQATPMRSAEVIIGDIHIGRIGGQVSWSTFSDSTFKTNVFEDVPGLDFITSLRPVTYNYDLEKLRDWRGEHHNIVDTSDFPGKADLELVRYSGFLAQEVETAAQSIGYDFSGVCAPAGADDLFSLRYAEFVVPMVQAIQEQQVIIEALEYRIEQLEAGQ